MPNWHSCKNLHMEVRDKHQQLIFDKDGTASLITRYLKEWLQVPMENNTDDILHITISKGE